MTLDVDIVKVAVVCPAATVTEAGTVATALLLERLTASPACPAGPLSVTVPVEVVPSRTAVGFKDNATTDAGMIVRLAA